MGGGGCVPFIHYKCEETLFLTVESVSKIQCLLLEPHSKSNSLLAIGQNCNDTKHTEAENMLTQEHYLMSELLFLLTLFFRCTLSANVTLVKSRDRSCGRLHRILARYFLCSSSGFPWSVRLYSWERCLSVFRTLPSSVRRFPWRYIIFKLENSASSAEMDVNLLKERSSHVRCSGLSTTCNMQIEGTVNCVTTFVLKMLCSSRGRLHVVRERGSDKCNYWHRWTIIKTEIGWCFLKCFMVLCCYVSFAQTERSVSLNQIWKGADVESSQVNLHLTLMSSVVTLNWHQTVFSQKQHHLKNAVDC